MLLSKVSKMKYAIFILMLIPFTNIAQTDIVNFVPNTGEYSIELDNRVRYKRVVNEGDYTDFYTFLNRINKDEIDFIFTIGKDSHESFTITEMLNNEEYLSDYKLGCDCEIISRKAEDFKNFRAVVYEIKKESKGRWRGNSIHFSNKGNFYTLTYIAKSKSYEDYRIEALQMIKSLNILE